MSLTVEPAQMTLKTGQTQRFSAEVKGAPAGTEINWAVRESGGNISQDGVFTASVVGIYHVVALATRRNTVLMQASAKITVVMQYDGPVPR
jgi:Bacterial Ig-like domain (group 2)